MRKGFLRLMIGARLQSFGTVSNRPSSFMYYVLRHSNRLAADTPYLKPFYYAAQTYLWPFSFRTIWNQIMAPTSSHYGLGLTPESIESFASSLKLSSHNKTLVLDVLQDLAQASVDITDTVLAKQKRISASGSIASLALGSDVLLEGPSIQKAVCESWL